MPAKAITIGDLSRMIVQGIEQQIKIGSTHARHVDLEYLLATPLTDDERKDLERIAKTCQVRETIRTVDASQRFCQRTGKY